MSVKNVVMVMTLLVGVFALVGWTLLRGIDYPLVPRPNDYMVLSAIADALLMPATVLLILGVALAFRSYSIAAARTAENDAALKEHADMLKTLNKDEQPPEAPITEEQKNLDVSARYKAKETLRSRGASLAIVGVLLSLNALLLSTAAASWWLEGGDECHQGVRVVNQFTGILAADGPHNLCDFGRKGDHA